MMMMMSWSRAPCAASASTWNGLCLVAWASAIASREAHLHARAISTSVLLRDTCRPGHYRVVANLSGSWRGGMIVDLFTFEVGARLHSGKGTEALA